MPLEIKTSRATEARAARGPVCPLSISRAHRPSNSRQLLARPSVSPAYLLPPPAPLFCSSSRFLARLDFASIFFSFLFFLSIEASLYSPCSRFVSPAAAQIELMVERARLAWPIYARVRIFYGSRGRGCGARERKARRHIFTPVGVICPGRRADPVRCIC